MPGLLLILLIAVQAITAPLARAGDDCRCLWQGSFIDSAGKADLVVTGTAIWQGGNAVDIEVANTIAGEEFQPVIRVWGNYPGTCRPELTPFRPQSQWLLALFRIDNDVPGGFNPNTPGFSYGRVGDYYLSACGANWLTVNDGFADGNIVNGPRWQWQNEENSAVIVELIAAYLQGDLPRDAIIEAAKPQTETKRLMRETLDFLRQ